MKLLRFLFIFVSFGLAAQFDEVHFKENSDKFGNKVANLMELQKISNDIKIDEFLVEVPDILTISQKEMVEFLGNAQEDIIKNWRLFQIEQKGKTKIDNNASVFLENIINTLNNYFKVNKFTNNNLEQFLLNKKDKLLMVRSSGREDSVKISNAGGNESISSVKPNIDNINNAINKVIVSYFSEKSITQRILSGDKSIYSEDPFMPVFLQEMISEKDNNIPTSGVMFSLEAEGPTQGLTRIESIFGHNEAVVNGFLRADSYFAFKDNVFPSIVRKDKRLAGGPEGLLWKNNHPDLAKRPSLDKNAVLALKKVADVIEKYYNDQPMDIEFVVLNNVIYLIQARPIEQAPTKPTYIKQEHLDQIDQKHINKDVNFIGQGGGGARVITEAREVIQDKTLRGALLKYLSLENKDNVKMVVVEEMAPSTSHEATIFRRSGIVTLVSSSLKNNTKYPIILDPQRGLWIKFDSQEDMVSDGWYHHPLRPTISIGKEWHNNVNWPKKLNFNPDHKDLNISELLLRLAYEDTTDSVLYKVYRAINNNKNDQLILLSSNILNTVSLIKETKYNSLQRLFLISVLESFLFANKDKDVLNSPSLAGLLRNQKIDDKFIKKSKLLKNKYSGHMAIYARLGKLAISLELKKQWNSFLKELALKPKEVQANFGEMFFTLGRLDLLPLWLNNIFYKNQDINLLIKDYRENEKYLEPIKDFIESIKNYNFAAFEKFDGFDKRFYDFKKIIAPLNKQGELFNTFNKEPKLAQMACLSAMRILVEKFDLSIKALKASEEYTDELQQVLRFKLMVIEYFFLMKNWIDLGNMAKISDITNFISLETYLSKIEKNIEATPMVEAQLSPSPDFSVYGASLGSQASLDRSWGKNPTLENMFSLCHQNLLLIIATLGKEIGITDLSISDLFKKVLTGAKGIRIQRNKGFLLGIDINNNSVTYFYNLPLRNHSSTFQVHYRFWDKKIKIDFQFIGEARRRWDVYANLITVLFPRIDLKLLRGPSVDKTSGLLEFSVELVTEKQIDKYFNILKIIANNSLDPFSGIESEFKNIINKSGIDNAVLLNYFISDLVEINHNKKLDYWNIDSILIKYPDIILENPYFDKNNFFIAVIKSDPLSFSDIHSQEKFTNFLLTTAQHLVTDENFIKKYGDTLTQFAFQNELWDIIELFFDNFDKNNFLSIGLINKPKCIPKSFLEKLSKLLLKNDAILIGDVFGKLIIESAFENNQMDLVRHVIKKLSKTLLTSPFYEIKNRSMTLLHAAAFYGLADIVKFLLEKEPEYFSGKKDDLKDSFGYTPLDYAKRKKREDIVELLKVPKKSHNVIKKDMLPRIQKGTSLHDACKEGDIETAKSLLKQGNFHVDIRDPFQFNETPLHIACTYNCIKVVKLLIANGADPNAKNNFGETPLHLACNKGHKAIAEWLIANGADPNAKNNFGETPRIKQ